MVYNQPENMKTHIHSYQFEPFLTLLGNADQTVSLSWSGAGVLEQTESLIAPNWQPAPNQENPQTISTTDPMKFYRVKAD